MLFSWANDEYNKDNKEATVVTGNCDLNYMQCTISPLWQTSIECCLEEKIKEFGKTKNAQVPLCPAWIPQVQGCW